MKSPEEKELLEKPRNIYIIKPGEETNRGFGISIEKDL